MNKTIGIYAYMKRAGDTFGGVEAHVTHLARSLSDRGYRVVLHCLANEEAGVSGTPAGFRFVGKTSELDSGITEFQPTHGPGYEGALKENLHVSKSKNEEIILCFGTRDGYAFRLATDASKELNIPLVSFIYFTIEERWFRSYFTSRTRSIAGLASATERAELFSEGAKVISDVVQASQLVIVPTHYVKGQVLSISGIEATPKLKVCYHGADPQIFNNNGRKEWDPHDDMLNVARLSIPFACHKGFLWAAQFFSENKTKLSAKRLVFCGAGNGHAVIKKYAEEQGVSEALMVAGFMDQKKLAAQYRNASFLLIPSMMEAGSTVVVEAIMSGCLPIALDAAGLTEVMENIGLDDFVVPGRRESLGSGIDTIVPEEKAMLQILNDASDRLSVTRERIIAAKSIAAQKFSLEATTGRLLDTLRQRGLI